MLSKNNHSLEVMNRVIRFLTPFAILLVLVGDIFADPSPRALQLSIAIVLVTTLGNVAASIYMNRNPKEYLLIRKTRVAVNYAFNIALIYLMLPYWTPIWMLFLLTIIAVGVYENRETTVIHATLFTVVLFMIAFQRGLLNGNFTYELAAYAIAIWFVGLFVNGLAGAAHFAA